MVSGLALVLYAFDNLQNILIFIGLGVLAILAAIAYTVGNKPYGYVGLGDLSVFLFLAYLVSPAAFSYTLAISNGACYYRL